VSWKTQLFYPSFSFFLSLRRNSRMDSFFPPPPLTRRRMRRRNRSPLFFFFFFFSSRSLRRIGQSACHVPPLPGRKRGLLASHRGPFFPHPSTPPPGDEMPFLKTSSVLSPLDFISVHPPLCSLLFFFLFPFFKYRNRYRERNGCE